MKQEYNVCFSAYGGVTVEAESAEEAEDIVKKNIQDGNYEDIFENLAENGMQSLEITNVSKAE